MSVEAAPETELREIFYLFSFPFFFFKRSDENVPLNGIAACHFNYHREYSLLSPPSPLPHPLERLYRK